MTRVRLIHWNESEAKPRIEALKKLCYQVEFEVPSGPQFLRELNQNPPDAIVIDLTRLPSQGRDMALTIRKANSTRNKPIVFAGGDPAKVERIRRLLPDAFYTQWSGIDEAFKAALSSPPENPVVPESNFAAYSGTPLWKKLGIKPHMVVGLINPPDDLQGIVEPIPEGARFQRGAEPGCALLIAFVRNRDELVARVRETAERKDLRSAWLAWPKKSSGIQSDLTQQQVREVGLAHGLVDYKICSIDATWSALLFTHRSK